MWKFSVALLIVLFTWNSVSGNIGTLALCLHSDGKMHIESAGEISCPNVKDCLGAKNSVDTSDCVSCMDIELKAVDLGLMKLHEPVSVHTPSPIASDVHTLLAKALFLPKFHTKYGQPTRAPPEANSTTQQISRTIVLRL